MTTSHKCEVCGKTAYPMESIAADNKHYHKTCFKCVYCRNTLKLGNYAALGGKFYCKPHFKQLFQLKGNYSGGFGEDKPTAKWDALNASAGSSSSSTPAKQPEPVKAHEPAKPAPKPVHEHEPEPHPEGPDPSFTPPTVSFHGLTMEEFEDAQRKFHHFDTDGNGSIDKDEFLVLMRHVVGSDMPDTVLKSISDAMFAAADKDHGGSIDEVEFLVVYNDLNLGKFKDI